MRGLPKPAQAWQKLAISLAAQLCTCLGLNRGKQREAAGNFPLPGTLDATSLVSMDNISPQT